MPCGFRITPTAMRVPASCSAGPLMDASVDDVEHVTTPRASRGSRQKDPHRSSRTTLPTDDLAQIGLGDFQLQNRLMVSLHRTYPHGVRVVDERLRDELDQLFHYGCAGGCAGCVFLRI